MTETVIIGGLELRLPAGCTAKLLGSGEDTAAVREFVLASPDHTVYHLEPYLAFARADPEGGACDVALVSHDGNPAFAIPLHVRPPSRVVSGYSGILLPPTGTEAAVRRSIEALGAFLAANPAQTFEVIQAAQAPAYDDPRRLTLVRRYLAELGLSTRPVFTRVLSLPEPAAIEEAPGSFPGSVTIAPDCLDSTLLGLYDGDARNQIRQALRAGLTVDVFFGERGEGTASAYELIQPLHEATWSRSGWPPHPNRYWQSLSAAINQPEGGSDLVVIASDANGSPLAAVVCHRYRGRALYWSGCSSDAARAARANPLCLHAAITACAATGTTLFEIGRFDARERSEKERAVTRYKSQFRGDLLEVVNFSRLTARARAVAIAGRLRDRAGALVRR
jgi:Acetyltransferase (GNAT) domain